MRVISGELKGRGYDAPKGHRTHPTSDKIRGAIFNKLGDIEGLSVLDAYAGGGSMGIEAASRGAASVLSIDVDKRAHDTLVHNLKELGLIDRIKPVRAKITSWSELNPDAQFDVIICDPPFDDYKLAAVQQVSTHLKSTGIMVLSYPGREASPPHLRGVVVVDNRIYGDAALALYRQG